MSNHLSSSTREFLLQWRADSEMSIWAETRWTAACASLKEEILEMFNDDIRENFLDKVRYVPWAHDWFFEKNSAFLLSTTPSQCGDTC